MCGRYKLMTYEAYLYIIVHIHHSSDFLFFNFGLRFKVIICTYFLAILLTVISAWTENDKIIYVDIAKASLLFYLQD